MSRCPDEVLLGIGHGFLVYSQQIVLGVKDLRQNYFSKIGVSIPKVHIVDHDIEDSNGNFSQLERNEYVIYFNGEEALRSYCVPEQYEEILDTLKLQIEKNIKPIDI